MGNVVELLDRPIYLMPDVDRLLSLSSGTARRWIDGYQRSGIAYSPVVRNESTGLESVTWGEFVETRLLALFRDQDIRLPQLRRYMELLRERFGNRYPLAHSKTFLTVDGREILLRSQDEAGTELSFFTRLDTGQTGFAAQTREFLSSVQWSNDPPAAGVVDSLSPVARLAAVCVNPKLRFGDPQVAGIQTSVLAELYRAGDAFDQITDWYGITPVELREALEFEGLTVAV